MHSILGEMEEHRVLEISPGKGRIGTVEGISLMEENCLLHASIKQLRTGQLQKHLPSTSSEPRPSKISASLGNY